MEIKIRVSNLVFKTSFICHLKSVFSLFPKTFIPSHLINISSRKQHACVYDNVIRILDEKTFEEVAQMEGHSGYVICMIPLPQNRMASGSTDGSITIWDTKTLKPIITLKEHSCAVNCLVYLKNGNMASGDDNGNIYIWDMVTYRKIGELIGHTDRVNSFDLPIGADLASASDDKTVKIWDVGKLQMTAELTGHRSRVSCLCSDHKHLISGSMDNSIIVWNIRTSKAIVRLNGHDDYIHFLAIIGDYLVSYSNDRTISVWDRKNDFKSIGKYGEYQDVVPLHNFSEDSYQSNTEIYRFGSYEHKTEYENQKDKFDIGPSFFKQTHWIVFSDGTIENIK